MEKINFTAPEYQADGSFEYHDFTFSGDEKDGWIVLKDNATILELPKGYVPVQTRYCGVCSTDLARQFLPYPLPQIIGHEVVVEKDNQFYAVEINASQRARGIEASENPYSHDSMHTQDPQRITLGINQLPGGFSPWLLAPIQALVKIPDRINNRVASLTEPFAAALQAVECTPPRNGERVCVLGPRRLGAMIIAALAGYKNNNQLDFEIVSLSRHPHLNELCQKLGADRGILLDSHEVPQNLYKYFDVVYDTTGNPQGLESAFQMAKRAVHLKSTNGQKVAGLDHLTDLVVDELALLPFSEENLHYTWPSEDQTRSNHHIFIPAPQDQSRIAKSQGLKLRNCVIRSIDAMADEMFAEGGLHKIPALKDAPYYRFDLALASSLSQIDRIIRPKPPRELALVRARGAILLDKPFQDQNYLTNAILENNVRLYTSRCGDFQKALDILATNPAICSAIDESMITHTYTLDNIEEAFTIAKDSHRSIKVIVQTN